MRHLLALFIILVAVTFQVQAQGSFHSPMLPFPGTDNLPSEGDRSKLVRYRSFAKIHITTTGLDPSSPYTLWAVIFNNPQHCLSSPCSAADLPVIAGHNPRVEASIIYAGGGLADADGSGEFVGRVYANRLGTDAETLFGHGLASTAHAEIHMVVRGHGYPQAQDAFAAIGSFAGGCNAQNAHSGPCEDQQFAVHQVAEAVYQNDIIDQGDDHE